MGERFTITLSDNLAALVRERVASGDYASVDDVVGDALWLTLEPQPARNDDPAVEHWLRTEVVERLRELDADPSQVMTMAEVDAMIEDEAKRLGVAR